MSATDTMARMPLITCCIQPDSRYPFSLNSFVLSLENCEKFKRLVDPSFVVTTSHNAFIGHCFRAKVVYILQHFGSRQKHCFRLVGRFNNSSARGAIFFPYGGFDEDPKGEVRENYRYRPTFFPLALTLNCD